MTLDIVTQSCAIGASGAIVIGVPPINLGHMRFVMHSHNSFGMSFTWEFWCFLDFNNPITMNYHQFDIENLQWGPRTCDSYHPSHSTINFWVNPIPILKTPIVWSQICVNPIQKPWWLWRLFPFYEGIIIGWTWLYHCIYSGLLGLPSQIWGVKNMSTCKQFSSNHRQSSMLCKKLNSLLVSRLIFP